MVVPAYQTPAKPDSRHSFPRPQPVDSLPDTLNGGSRYCPVCDRYLDERVCPRDGVRTIPSGIIKSPAELLAPGTIVGDTYRIDGLLGEGAMGCVFAATNVNDDAQVAIKFLSSLVPKDKDEVRRFFREAELVQRVDHANVVRVLEFGVDDGTWAPFIVMQLVKGENLRSMLDREGLLDVGRVVRLLAQVAHALSEAHANDLVHRDLKPANLMVTRLPSGREHLTVIDFGVAKSLKSGPGHAELSQHGIVVGTPLYMSPEQATGAPVDARTDLYALGCLLHEMLTGSPPHSWPGGDGAPPELLPPPGVEVSVEVWARLQALQRALLATTPADRPTQAAEVAEELEAISAQASVCPSTPRPVRRIPCGFYAKSDRELGTLTTIRRRPSPLVARVARPGDTLA